MTPKSNALQWYSYRIIMNINNLTTAHFLKLRGLYYVYTHDLLEVDFHRPTATMWCTKGPCPLRLDFLQEFLSRHPDSQLASYLGQELTHGFWLGFSCFSLLPSRHYNHLALWWPFMFCMSLVLHCNGNSLCIVYVFYCNGLTVCM